MKDAKIILMDIPWDYQYGRQAQHGICRYAWPDKAWTFARLWSRDEFQQWMGHSNTAGIISMRRPQDYIPRAMRRGLAAVGIGASASTRKHPALPYVDVNPKALGKMAADYFTERGFRNFGMIATNKLAHSQSRREGFAEVLKRRKLTCDVFSFRKKYPQCGDPIPGVADYGDESVRRWLSSLPKPLAIFAIDDYTGLWVCEVCSHCGIRVPEEVAVLGVDDDAVFCSVANPHLSSIRIPAEQIGYEAARLLDNMLSGQDAPVKPVLLPPMEVVTRQSTDVMAVDDYYVTKALQFIRNNALEGIRVEHVMAEVRLSRRPLERRFKLALGRSPFSEIRRVQLENIKAMLTRTDKTLESIAPKCGFANVVPMSKAFKQATGMTPGNYRKQFRN